MLRIDPGEQVCTVIVTVDTDPETMVALVEHARLGLDRFRECDSYRAGAVHVSEDRERLVQYSQWTSEAGYQQCRDDPRWDALPSTVVFMDHVASGRARVDARVFSVIDSSER